MTGTIALLGGGPFEANDDLDRRLLTEAGATEVVVMPTADAFEHPRDLIDASRAWAERIGVAVRPLEIYTRGDALDVDVDAAIGDAVAVYLVGDSPIHLRSVLTDTDLWAAIAAVVERGGLIAAVAGSAAALCNPMTDPRGGAFTIGLGLIDGLAVATETETWTEERLHRTRDLADVPVAEVPTGAALLRRNGSWEIVGDVVIDGELPD